MDFQAWLDDWGDTILANDVEGFLAGIQFPARVTITEADLDCTVSTPEHFVEAFALYRNMLISCGATMFLRSILGQDMLEDGRVKLHAESHVLRGSERVLAPSLTHIYLVASTEGWKANGLEVLPQRDASFSDLPCYDLAELIPLAPKADVGA